jgi:hypothetical protein
MSNQCDSAKETCAQPAAATAESECPHSPENLLSLADEAWKELLKDKIKQEIEKSTGAKLSTIAKLVSEGNHRRWTHLLEGKQKCEEFTEQLNEALISLTK